jgi:hypothetical protein
VDYEEPNTAPLRPHSELFRTERGELVEVEWLIVSSDDWHNDKLSGDRKFRVLPLPNDCVVAQRASI